MKRIGILGGTFDPIHFGHLTIAQTVYEKLSLNKVLFVPCYLPPHKSSRGIAAASDRYKMVNLAVKDNAAFDVLDYEIKQKVKSYSIDTVEHLKGMYPSGTKFFFIIGEDHCAKLHTWKEIGKLAEHVAFVSVSRGCADKAKAKIKAKHISMPTIDISSSDIKNKIALRQTIRYLVPDDVQKYIQRHKTYSSK